MGQRIERGMLLWDFSTKDSRELSSVSTNLFLNHPLMLLTVILPEFHLEIAHMNSVGSSFTLNVHTSPLPFNYRSFF